MAFDLVSKEYGWSDEKILNLTVKRLRQITAVINRRRWLEDRQEWDRMAWQTRQLASFTAAGYFSENNKDAVESAQMLSYDEIDEAIQEEKKARQQANPVKEKYQKEAPVGSFERFMGSMANPQQWGGR